eukprot:GHVP01026716.1.p1 GENE.GHVP01026716.1~~GHVP01026716.1.p1  ORF type:complete len:824 (-),score=116.86 GHVP01026716.1:241-2712(-)
MNSFTDEDLLSRTKALRTISKKYKTTMSLEDILKEVNDDRKYSPQFLKFSRNLIICTSYTDLPDLIPSKSKKPFRQFVMDQSSIKAKKKNNDVINARLTANPSFKASYLNKIREFLYSDDLNTLYSILGEDSTAKLLDITSIYLFQNDNSLLHISGAPLKPSYKGSGARIGKTIDKTIVFYSSPRIINRRMTHKPISLYMEDNLDALHEKINKTKNINLHNIVCGISQKLKRFPFFSILSSICPRNDKECSNDDVFSFLNVIIKRTIPLSVFGVSENRYEFMKKMRILLFMSKYESITIDYLTISIKSSLIPCCYHGKKRSDSLKRDVDIKALLLSIVSDIIFPVIKACFYVTESKNGVLYYRHETWQKRTSIYLNGKKDEFKRVNPTNSSMLKLLPKGAGFRTIIIKEKKQYITTKENKTSSIDKENTSFNINKDVIAPNTMKAANSALKRASFEKRSISVSGIEDIRRTIGDFKQSMIKEEKHYSGYHAITLDITNFFDSINQQTLLGILENKLAFLKNKEFLLDILKITSNGFNGTRLEERFDLLDRQDTSEFNIKPRTQRSGKVISINKKPLKLDGNDLLEVIKNAIEKNYVKFGHGTYKKIKGISQGCILSSELGSIFLDSIESEMDDIMPKESLLLRNMDDYLLISDDRDALDKFVNSLDNIFKYYGISLNPNKTKMSSSESPFIDWHCFLLDSRDLNVFARESASSLLRISPMRRNTKFLSSKLKRSFVLSMKNIFLDPNVCSYNTVLENIKRLFTSCKERLDYYLRNSDIVLKKDTFLILRNQIINLAKNRTSSINHFIPLNEVYKIGIKTFSYK